MIFKFSFFICCLIGLFQVYGQKKEVYTSTLSSLKLQSEKSSASKYLFISNQVINADTRINTYLHLLKNKNVAIIANHSSVINGVNLVDTLLQLGIKVKKVFSPEHGFRGTADAGEHIKNAKDAKTGLPIISLYGKNVKPKPSDLKDIDILVYDLQDVGVRFYTYLSTLFYTMQAAAELGKEYVVLDRPNPNGFYVDGPVLQDSCKSYVGILPIPIVHGCTMGEMAKIIFEENWLNVNKKFNLEIIPLENYTHQTLVELPVKPSPNLPNFESIMLYPSLCLFEGTVISVGRGTPYPFQLYGHPKFPKTDFIFKPESMPGASKNPPYQNQNCYGFFIKDSAYSVYQEKKINWSYLINAYQLYPEKSEFFTSYFKNLVGNNTIKKLIESGATPEDIQKSYAQELEEFKVLRSKYLIYPEK